MDRGRTNRAVDLWLLDLALTVLSFYLAYRLRALFDVQGHTVMPVDVYLPLLLIILPVWAVVLPMFRVYSASMREPLDVVWRTTKAVAIAWLIVAAVAVSRGGSSRLVLLF